MQEIDFKCDCGQIFKFTKNTPHLLDDIPEINCIKCNKEFENFEKEFYRCSDCYKNICFPCS